MTARLLVTGILSILSSFWLGTGIGRLIEARNWDDQWSIAGYCVFGLIASAIAAVVILGVNKDTEFDHPITWVRTVVFVGVQALVVLGVYVWNGHPMDVRFMYVAFWVVVPTSIATTAVIFGREPPPRGNSQS